MRVVDATHPKGDPTNYPTHITRYWPVTQNGYQRLQLHSDLHYVENDEVIGTGQSTASLYHWSYSSPTWTLHNQANATTNTLSSSVSSFSDQTARSGSPLAVTLADFSAMQQGDCGPPHLGNQQRAGQPRFQPVPRHIAGRVGSSAQRDADPFAIAGQPRRLHLHLGRPRRPGSRHGVLLLGRGCGRQRRDDDAWAGECGLHRAHGGDAGQHQRQSGFIGSATRPTRPARRRYPGCGSWPALALRWRWGDAVVARTDSALAATTGSRRFVIQ